MIPKRTNQKYCLKNLKEWYYYIAEQANWHCEYCKALGLYVPGVEAHHIIGRGEDPQYKLDKRNGVFLSLKYHRPFHNGDIELKHAIIDKLGLDERRAEMKGLS